MKLEIDYVPSCYTDYMSVEADDDHPIAAVYESDHLSAMRTLQVWALELAELGKKPLWSKEDESRFNLLLESVRSVVDGS